MNNKFRYRSKLIKVVRQFNDCINEQDLAGLARLMTDNHALITSPENIVRGKANCLKSWEAFFEMFPDYKNTFTAFSTRETVVVIAGYSSCSDERLNGPALWTARIAGDKVKEWRVYGDTEKNRALLGLTALDI